jgi:hypothetical protein
MNIIEYVKNAHKTFAEEPFCPIDSLVLCEIIYVKIEAVLDGLLGHTPVDDDNDPTYTGASNADYSGMVLTVKDFYKAEYFEGMFSDAITDDDNLALLTSVAASRRFRDLTVKNVVMEFDEEKELQFAACCFEIDADTDYVAFRGTDGTLIGWKEDFNLSFMDEVPSQKLAVKYFEKYYGKGSAGENKRIYTGGHSKGGNLAIYGLLMSGEDEPTDGNDIKNRVITAFSHDGPGYRDEVLEELEKRAELFEVNIDRTLPQSSVIGILMESNEDYKVVKSESIGIFQHSAYSWQVDPEERDFVYLDKLSRGGEFHDRTIHTWVAGATDEQRETFVNVVFGVLLDNDINTLHDLKRLSPGQVKALIETFKGMDDEETEIVKSLLRALIGIAIKQLGPGVNS